MARLTDNLSNLPSILKIYRDTLLTSVDDVSINGKNIESANIEQPSLIARYDELKVELKIMVDYIDVKIAQRRSQAFKQITDGSSLDYSDRAKERMIDDDPTYVDLSLKMLDVKELYLKYDSVIKQLEQRSYSLTNIVKIREKELQNITLYKDE
jgi:methyl coenzyme M reductase subunit C-like uncharacterized protein (methanogenesis marker protein 7)